MPMSKQGSLLERNKEAYDILFKLENSLRSFIQKKLDLEFRDEGGWKNRIHPDIIKKCETRAIKERRSYQDLRSSQLLDYSDFKDIERIILEKENWERVFKVHFGNPNEIAIKLEELEPIRNTIAHNRIISKKELMRLRVFSDDIERCISREETGNI